MKEYDEPKLELRAFSDERIMTASGSNQAVKTLDSLIGGTTSNTVKIDWAL